ncbi:MAG: class I SAM-dependent methyltransferase family protein [Candidatus Aenigmarchaeota archaeon]|nr:class I SAM-dependent methyltransferase family protein [Candidatus Aenigmarchaeota archaeon]
MGIPAFDIIGDVAIVEIEGGENEKGIAKLIVKNHPHIKTVLRKMGGREGKYRVRKFKKILGKETETEHKEHGCRFRMDVAKVYFSPREATERQRIAEQVKRGESVMVMFAGIGSFPVIVAKKNPKVGQIYGIEINPHAFKYMVENVRINKVGHKVMPVLGDVKKVAKDYSGLCDRVVMPLPKEGYRYLPEAFQCLKKKGTIHFYYYEHERDLFTKALETVRKTSEKMNKRVKIINKRKVLPYGPRVWKICIDFEVCDSK